MKILSLFFSIVLVIQAQTLESLLQSAYANDPTLKVLLEEVKLSQEDVSVADIWENPILSAGMTDIRLDDIASRSLEPMQTQFVTISQKIPLSDKFEISRSIAEEKEKQVTLKIENRKQQIRARLSAYVSKISIIKKRLQLLGKNRNNLYQIKKLLKGYQADEELILEIGASLSLLLTTQKMLQSQKEALLTKIKRYTLQKISTVSMDLHIFPVEAKYNSKHPLLQMYRQDIMIAEKKVALFRAKEIPDFTLSGGYYQRVDRDDYISLSVAVPLQIRGKEKLQVQKAKAVLAYQKAKLFELENRFANKVEVLKIKMQKSSTNYTLYQKRILPLQKRISRYLRAKNRSAALDQTKLIESYNKVIALEDAAFKELDAYFQNYSTLRYYL